MIKASELRFGNLMYAATDENDKQIPCKVLQLFEEVVHWTNDLKQTSIKDGYSATDYNYIDPIPVTTEILEKAGFEVEDMADIGKFINLKISIPDLYLNWIEETETIWVGEYDTKVKHLHQLQNLYFALTGEELEIKL